MTTLAKSPQTTTASTVAVALMEAEQLLARYAKLYAQRAQLMADAKAAAEPLTAELDSLMAGLHHWADTNPAAFGGKKMLKLEPGEFGYRAGLKKLVLPLELAADKYLNAVRKVLPPAIEESVNARLVIQGWDLVADVEKTLSKLGITVQQEDNFIVTPKK